MDSLAEIDGQTMPATEREYSMTQILSLNHRGRGGYNHGHRSFGPSSHSDEPRCFFALSINSLLRSYETVAFGKSLPAAGGY